MILVSEEQQLPKYRSLLLVAIIILFIIGKTGVTYPITLAVNACLFPLLEGTRHTKAVIQNEWATLTQLRAQRTQIQTLQEENTRLAAENAFLKIMREEQRTWYSQNKVLLRDNFIPIPATIIASHDVLQITLKAKGEVKKNDVIVARDHLIGIVEKSERGHVTGIPITQLSSDVPVAIVGKEGVKGRGMLTHSFGTTVEVQRVLQDIPVEKDDSVILLPQDTWPDNIKVGDVAQITKRESDVFQTLTLSQPVDISRTLNVIVYTKTDD